LKYSSADRGFPAGNPIANVFIIIVGALAIGASVVLGFFAFIVLGSIVAVLAAAIGLRLWWFNRKLRRQVHDNGSHEQAATGGVIEGEYHVIEDDAGNRRDD
jgi:membrane protein implicated in regulation of membrane protease activity